MNIDKDTFVKEYTSPGSPIAFVSPGLVVVVVVLIAAQSPICGETMLERAPEKVLMAL